MTDLVSTAEIAQKLNVGPSAVSNWRTRGAFPKPLASLKCGPVWEWSTVQQWAEDTGRIEGINAEAIKLARKLLPNIREQVRREVDAMAYDVRHLVDTDTIGKPPARLNKDGSYRRGGLWDWFFALPRSERRHLAARYMRGHLAPDQYAEIVAERLGVRIQGAEDIERICGEWLHACRAMTTATTLRRGQGRTFGHLDTSYDVAELFGPEGAQYLARTIATDTLDSADQAEQFETYLANMNIDNGNEVQF